MKRKKLKFLNIKENLLNRDELKSIMAGSGTCSCTSADGCGVAMAQFPWGWTMTICCDGYCQDYNGPGPYGGTVCGGSCP